MRSNKRNLCLKLIVTISSVVILIGFIWNERTQYDDGRKELFYVSIDGTRINTIQGADSQYLLLPKFVKNRNDINSQVLESEKNLKVMYSSEIPSIFITTKSGNLESIYADKDYHESGDIKIINSDGTEEYSDGIKYIKGRGNYSWDNWAKKPFAICLKKETSILGLGKGTKYALIANASDPTLIRNDIARDLEVAVGLDYSHTGQFVDLYINGDYMGNYYLIDTIEISEERIDITNLEEATTKELRGTSPSAFPVYETPLIKGWNLPELVDDNTGGYLIEREFEGRYKVDYQNNPSCFTTDYDEHFLVKSPQYCSKKQINYLCSFITNLEGAIRTTDGINPVTGLSYLDYIDIYSMAQKYLVEEYTKNYDSGVSSSYFYKDIDSIDSKLHAAPGWDYDMSLGNYLDWMDFKESGAVGFIHDTDNEDASVWWEDLFDKPEFADEVLDLYSNNLRTYVMNQELRRIDMLANKLSASAQMDYIRWKEMYDDLGYIPGDEKGYNELKKFMRDRIKFLDGE